MSWKGYQRSLRVRVGFVLTGLGSMGVFYTGEKYAELSKEITQIEMDPSVSRYFSLSKQVQEGSDKLKKCGLGVLDQRLSLNEEPNCYVRNLEGRVSKLSWEAKELIEEGVQKKLEKLDRLRSEYHIYTPLFMASIAILIFVGPMVFEGGISNYENLLSKQEPKDKKMENGSSL